MTAAVLAPQLSLADLRAWLTAAEEVLRDMPTDDPRYASGLALWNVRLEAYMARAIAEEATTCLTLPTGRASRLPASAAA